MGSVAALVRHGRPGGGHGAVPEPPEHRHHRARPRGPRRGRRGRRRVRRPASSAVVAGFLVYDLVFIPPYYTLAVGTSENWVALGRLRRVMLLVARWWPAWRRPGPKPTSTSRAIRRLFELTDLLIEDRPLPELLELIVSTVHEAFALRSVALLLPVDTSLDVVAAAGRTPHGRRAARSRPGARDARQPGDVIGGRVESSPQTVALTATGRPIGLLHIMGRGPQPSRPGPAAHLRQPHGPGAGAGPTARAGDAHRAARGGRPTPAGARGCRLPRPAHAAGHHQGLGLDPAQSRRRRQHRRSARSFWRSSTTRPTGSTAS